MAYSDYGSYNWKKESGKWVYKPEFEDTNLMSQITGKEPSKELIDVLGIGMPLKIGAVKNSLELEKEYPDLPFEIIHTHHSVIGSLKGYAVVSYKGHPKILYKGVVIDEFKETDLYKKDYSARKHIKVLYHKDGDNEVKVTMDTSENWWSIAYVKNGNDEYLSICGYGLGEHWWLDKDGKEDTGDGINSDEKEWFDADTLEPIPNPHYRWPREKECLNRSLKILNIK